MWGVLKVAGIIIVVFVAIFTIFDLVTPDEKNFMKVVDGFKFWKNYRCYGTNNNP